MDFKQFRDLFRANFDRMQKSAKTLYTTNCEKDALYEQYLNAFEPSIRQEFTCSCCKNFLRPFANVVAIVNNEMITPWDMKINDEQYQAVADAMRDIVLASKINGVFVIKQDKVYKQKTKRGDLVLGTESNKQQLETGKVITWNHFYLELDKKHQSNSTDSNEAVIGQFNTNYEVFMRGLKELTIDAFETALDLISTNSLNLGDTFKAQVEQFLKLKKEFDKVPEHLQSNFVWYNLTQVHDSVATIRNRVVGPFLIDLSEGMDLDDAIARHDDKTGANKFQRKQRMPTQKEAAKDAIELEKLGIIPSLETRHATEQDIDVSQILFVDKSVRANLSNPLLQVASTMSVTPKQLSKVEEISIDKFIADVLPTLKSLELQVDNSHVGNFMSVLKQSNDESPNINKWPNKLKWWYSGDVADSIKQRVKAAGGNVNAVLRTSLSWHNADDLDLHVIEPNGNRIYYGSKFSSTTGNLDVDMNAYGIQDDVNPVENTVWTDENKMREGRYAVSVNLFSSRRKGDLGFTVELEFAGQTWQFTSNDNQSKEVVVFEYTKANGIKIISSIGSSAVVTAQQKVWGVTTNQFTKVKMVMNSPNCWNEGYGHKHTFFILEGCINPERPRGYFQEFLPQELKKYSRSLEMYGDKLRVEHSDNQLSGVGFSSTQRTSVVVKAIGAVERIFKINF